MKGFKDTLGGSISTKNIYTKKCKYMGGIQHSFHKRCIYFFFR